MVKVTVEFWSISTFCLHLESRRFVRAVYTYLRNLLFAVAKFAILKFNHTMKKLLGAKNSYTVEQTFSVLY